jgi:SIR2-like protein
MRFIKNGPDVPERLLQIHEEGRVVFFCGAGISYPAGLPSFEGLARRLYDNLGMTPDSVQQAALNAHQYDTAIALLEDRHVGGRAAVRRELAAILTPADTSRKATRTQEALLTLGRRRDGKLRLVTTNFDRLFQAVIKRKRLKVNTCYAPLLPVPKNRWDGLVYLHGRLLSLTPSDSELDCLVVSSGDFGLAYLTERWASRFVSELFRHYTVCFVGYSLNDPVLRYMMDALAADRQRGEVPLERYAFTSYENGKKDASEAEWRAKNVTPILYEQTEDHRYLHKTLHSWSETYRDGVRGKEQIIVKEAIANPLIRTREDDFVGRVLWALSDESGLPARRFADLDPVPSLDWLEPLSENRYLHGDLGRFGVPPKPDPDDKLAFSLLRRPAPYDRAPLMALCDTEATGSQWDAVMSHLARWLTRHLDDPSLVLWLAKRGGHLHDRFVQLVDARLDEITKLERDGKTDSLDRMRASAPRAVPRPLLRTVWRLFLSGRIKSESQDDFNLYRWKERLQRDDWSPSLRLSLRELLTPCIQLREPFRWDEDVDKKQEPQHLKEIVDWELKLRTAHVHIVLREFPSSPQWQAVLPDLLPDFILLLRDALDLRRELGDADDRSDHSYVHQPSISIHPQNRDFHDWTVLIELTRDAWLALARRSVEQARLVAKQWRETPYPLFKRLAFFAAAQESITPPPLALEWLLADDRWWLWSAETQREVMRLLVALAPRLEPADLGRLEEAILTGPPRAMYRDDLDTEQWAQIVDHEIWLLLMKMASSGSRLGEKAWAAMDALCTKNPQWQLEENERDEFPFWMGTGGEGRKFVATPRRRRELIEWLKQNPRPSFWQEDDWQQRCRDQFIAAAYALYALSQEEVWPVVRWSQALQAWSEEKLLQRSWCYLAPVLARAPTEVIGALAHSLSWWLEALAKTFVGHQDLFFDMCLKILGIDHRDGLNSDDSDNPVDRAVNHPVGVITDALLHWWYRRELEDGQSLPDELEPILTRLCDPGMPAYQHARVLLATHVIALFRVDPRWTERNLLQHFDWQTSAAEARAVWRGFLWSPRLYPPLFELLKPEFLDTARHYAELGTHGRQYAALLTFAALEPHDTFTTDELKAATKALPEEGRQKVAQTLVVALEGAGEQRAEYWHNRILPYWRTIWPKSRDYKTQALSASLAGLCIAAREAFPQALEVLRPWLQPIGSDMIVYHLDQGKLSSRYPADVLEFLNIVVDTHRSPPHGLAKCLDDIKTANPELEEDGRFQSLMEFQRRYE